MFPTILQTKSIQNSMPRFMMVTVTCGSQFADCDESRGCMLERICVKNVFFFCKQRRSSNIHKVASSSYFHLEVAVGMVR